MTAGQDEGTAPAILEPDSLRHDAASGTVVLVGNACTRCERIFFPPRRRCAACATESLEPRDLASRGRVASFTRLHRTPRDSWVTAPYVIGEVLLPEGLLIYAHLVEVEWERLRIGMAVDLVPLILRGPVGTEIVAYGFRATDDGEYEA